RLSPGGGCEIRDGEDVRDQGKDWGGLRLPKDVLAGRELPHGNPSSKGVRAIDYAGREVQCADRFGERDFAKRGAPGGLFSHGLPYPRKGRFDALRPPSLFVREEDGGEVRGGKVVRGEGKDRRRLGVRVDAEGGEE